MKKQKYKPLVMIKIIRKHKGIKQKELAELSHVSVLTIQNLENGWTNPYESKYYVLKSIADALKVKIDDLFKDGI